MPRGRFLTSSHQVARALPDKNTCSFILTSHCILLLGRWRHQVMKVENMGES